jgi:polyferredoxin
MIKQRSIRQRTRQALLIASFLLFPLTINYFSPYLIVDSASQGVVNGNLIVFGSLFLSALFLGRLWCGWACPAGALGEIGFAINDRRVEGKKVNLIKWATWIPWLLLIVGMAVSAGGYRVVDLLYGTQGGISVAGSPDRPVYVAYVIYYFVILTFLGLSAFVGRRAGCHAICWMAPFMIVSRKLRNAFNWPSLRLKADPEVCTGCKKCTTNCPMSLDVNGMVQRRAMENSECILCGSCLDGCPNQAIVYSFSAGK